MTHVRRSDRAFRVGGDEFAILLPQASVDDGLVIARRMLAGAVGGGVPGQPIKPFSLSIGVSAYPAPTTEKHLLYRHADAALYWGKRHGRTTVVGYDPGKHGTAVDERSSPEIAAAVTAIIAERGLRPTYQPIFSLTTGDVVGFEGLVAPIDATRFPNASALFAGARAPIARSSSTWPAGDRRARRGRAARADLPERQHLAAHARSEHFQPSELRAIFGRHGITPDQLVLELTERQK